jgi:glucose-6-phosphate 1-dehydrogenase
VANNKPQTISYPAPGSRPRRHDNDPLDPHVIILFGATGDLAKRKLIPGLAYLDQSELAPDIQIVASSLEDLSDDDFRELAKKAIDEFGTHKLNSEQWEDFAKNITYVSQGAGPEALANAVAQAEEKLGSNARRLHYLSVPPKAARDVITMLCDAKLVERSRVVMEKPFGTDLASAVSLNDFLHETFQESQIFRIDHFLGKEAAQNILAFRFANGLFEPIWNRNFIDHIQIDIPEKLGLDQRANFYESTGAYKDMVVTHLFQVMAFVVMEPPTALEPRAISEEKNKVFRSMLPVKNSHVVRGQYAGYRNEKGVAQDSDTETFIALKVGIDNWRWAGVPIYLRTGKKMADGIRIISIAFKEAPRSMFPPGSGVGTQGPDHLTFDLADNSKVSLSFYGKRPGPGMKLDKVSMQFSTQEIDTVADVL